MSEEERDKLVKVLDELFTEIFSRLDKLEKVEYNVSIKKRE